ncbi:DUF2848 domain-containing protein [Rhizobium sp. CNPSo 4039]|uniref:DUF2848 domain-containing protein n=1 Tax=Rhizobium sp. CNPSo 4039 TaxID=3021409 RepID=UPI00254E7804|nr:DUF2848 domain-containing protein [Rhizobium sp. CNPSo 4039]MDK4716006.1 DUF2848 domain-containing protein [Rhizobium sp. CNPSo 4039]
MHAEFEIAGRTDADRLTVEISNLIVAGWAGRDRAAVEHHIRELAELGVAPPNSVPLYYRVGENNLTQNAHVQVLGEASSGEVECFIFASGGNLYVTVASDHTDRDLEAFGVAQSKQICPKPVASIAWRFDDVVDHWDELVMRSWIEEGGRRTLYQEGALSTLLAPRELINKFDPSSTLPSLPDGMGMICGTVPVIGGIRPASAFEMELYDPKRERSITHRYTVQSLPLVA